VVDINTHKPTFDRCASYNKIKVKEHSKIGSEVLTVSQIYPSVLVFVLMA
jgi:hypothetical protein